MLVSWFCEPQQRGEPLGAAGVFSTFGFVDIEEIGGAAIGIEFLFVDLKSDPRRIVVAFGRSLTAPTTH
jgi:hypothetical protein